MSHSTGSHFRSMLLGAALSLLAAAGGCSSPATPDNLEPVIETFQAKDVTRNDAVISAYVHQRGSAGFTGVSFHYGETGNIDREVTLDAAGIASSADTLVCQLTGLRPGVSYSWYVEGHTSTATVKSGTMTFVTVPNELPVVSRPVTLSTGPVGIIVSFDIIDDGGESLLEAGCEVVNNADCSVGRITLPRERLTVGSHRLHIGPLSLETNYTLIPFASNTIGEARGESIDYTTRNSILLLEAGSLESLFEGSAGIDLEQLTISGDMDGDDFRFLRILTGASIGEAASSWNGMVRDADLSDVNIVSGGGSYDGSHFTVDDELTTGLLADCRALRQVILPQTAKLIARDAFARCAALEVLTVPAAVGSVLPSAGCVSLREIAVSPANQNFKSVDGVLFNHDATEILWFPFGKSGDYTLPSTITGIGEGAFSGTGITRLYVPSSVTTISRGAFAGSSLAEISLPDNITNISEGMFQSCAQLATVRLGKGTEFIGNYAFDGTSLTDLYVAATIPPYASTNAFVNRLVSLTENCTLHVPSGCRAVYRNHSKWGKFSKIEEY